MLTPIVHVAVGAIIGSDGNILIAKRADKAHQGGLWEFPGGKVEQGETLFDALKRELAEELAIDVHTTEPLIKIRHDYGDKIVLLDVHKVTAFSGAPRGNEGQPIAWVAPEELYKYNFPAANRPIISAINLPRKLLITGEFSSSHALLSRTERGLKSGIRLVQLRMHDSAQLSPYLDDFVGLCKKYHAKCVVNTNPDVFSRYAGVYPELGLHLNSHQLIQLHERPVDKSILLGASCHNSDEIERAQKIHADFICLSPVLATTSHPEKAGLGWGAFEQLIEPVALPVFALGGMKESHLQQAISSGAQGIAAISEWW